MWIEKCITAPSFAENNFPHNPFLIPHIIKSNFPYTFHHPSIPFIRPVRLLRLSFPRFSASYERAAGVAKKRGDSVRMRWGVALPVRWWWWWILLCAGASHVLPLLTPNPNGGLFPRNSRKLRCFSSGERRQSRRF